ncbi:MAG: phosphopantetheine-binding protein [Nitrospiraceae bacterium]|nr:phosphopantetheine-binding protein [Nitrospiraceae bacterium]
MSASTLQRVKDLFVEKLKLNEAELTPSSTLDSLGLDSLDKIEFMFTIEEEFDIKIPDREVQINTIQDLIDTIDRFVAEQNPKKA